MAMKRSLLAAGLASLLLSGCVVLGVPGMVPGVFLVQTRIVSVEPQGTIVLAPGPVPYRALRFEVEGRPVAIYRVVVIYAGGEREDLHVNWIVTEGKWNRALQLRHRDRRVENVVLYYRPVSQQGGGKKEPRVEGQAGAIVRVYGVQ